MLWLGWGVRANGVVGLVGLVGVDGVVGVDVGLIDKINNNNNKHETFVNWLTYGRKPVKIPGGGHLWKLPPLFLLPLKCQMCLWPRHINIT